MGLREIAEALKAAEEEDLDLEPRLVAWFFNFLLCLEHKHVKPEAVRRRLTELIGYFERERRPGQDRVTLVRAFERATNRFHEDDHYERPQDLKKWLDQRAVTIQGDCGGDCGKFWLKKPEIMPAITIADSFRKEQCEGWIGQEHKPIWITPYVGEVEALCEEARTSGSSRQGIAIVSRVVAKLGLDFYPGEGLLAFITKKSIGELLFEHPSTRASSLPRGSTAIEARTHARFRVWPTSSDDDAYGRTYDRDKRSRQSADPRGYYGVAEAIRPRLPMDAFSDCIYLGDFTAISFDDADDDYLKAIEASGKSAAEMLERLAQVTGL